MWSRALLRFPSPPVREFTGPSHAFLYRRAKGSCKRIVESDGGKRRWFGRLAGLETQDHGFKALKRAPIQRFPGGAVLLGSEHPDTRGPSLTKTPL